MKTVRFASIVEQCGEPEAYLPLMDPAKDRSFQSAIKTIRVLTVFQENVGSKADRGEVGFEAGRGRQYFIFPKSLKQFAGRKVVGIKYEMVTEHEIPKSQRAAIARPPKKAKAKPAKREKPARAPKAEQKIVAFRSAPETDETKDEAEDDELADLKRDVRQAMAKLEEGKVVAAFNLLKRIVE